LRAERLLLARGAARHCCLCRSRTFFHRLVPCLQRMRAAPCVGVMVGTSCRKTWKLSHREFSFSKKREFLLFFFPWFLCSSVLVSKKIKGKIHLTSSPIHFIPLTPQQNLDPFYSLQLFDLVQSTPWLISRFCFYLYKLDFEFKFYEHIQHMMPYVKKLY
jgi:hypothetical protein